MFSSFTSSSDDKWGLIKKSTKKTSLNCKLRIELFSTLVAIESKPTIKNFRKGKGKI